MFDPQEALVNHTLSKSCYPIHELFPTNLLSFQELVNFGTPYFPLPFLNPTTYLPSNLTSTNWISSPYLINFPFSFLLCQGFAIGSIGLSLTLHTKKKNLVTSKVRNSSQSGFRPGDTTVNQVIFITHTIFKIFDCNFPLDVRSMYLDVSIVFDRVWHDDLIFILQVWRTRKSLPYRKFS